MKIEKIDNDWIVEQKTKIKTCKTNEELKNILDLLQRQGVSFRMKTHGSLFPISEIILHENSIRILFPIMWHKTFKNYSSFTRELNFELSDTFFDITNINIVNG